MEFFLVLKRRLSYVGIPGDYTYRKYKKEISEDCQHRCVYCGSHCSCFGGRDLMELDHFRPKSVNFFPHLKNDANNLVLACRSCNGKKRNDWPASTKSNLTHLDGMGYVDPFIESRSEYFLVNDDGLMLPLQDPALYVIEKLSLNRSFAIALRSRKILRYKLHEAISSLATRLREICCHPSPDMETISEIADLLDAANTALDSLFDEEKMMY